MYFVYVIMVRKSLHALMQADLLRVLGICYLSNIVMYAVCFGFDP